MSDTTTKRRRPAWRPLAVAVAGGALLVTTGFGVWATLSATAFNTTPQAISSGTLKLQLANNGNGFSTAITDMAPGDQVNRFVDLTNGGTLDAQGLTLGVAAAPNNALVTDGVGGVTTKGLRVSVSQCSTSWNTSTAVCTGSGTVTPLLTSVPLSTLVATPSSLISGAIPATTVAHLQVSVVLPDQAETTVNGTAPTNSIQGLTTNVTWTFTEAQRTATNTSS